MRAFFPAEGEQQVHLGKASGLTRATAFNYRVYAYDGAGNSGYTNTFSATTPDPLLSSPVSTVYTYDALGNFKTVVQGGNHNRTFTYKPLSQLTQWVNPESGQINYTSEFSIPDMDVTRLSRRNS